jgi:dipeptidyl-peptidase-4
MCIFGNLKNYFLMKFSTFLLLIFFTSVAVAQKDVTLEDVWRNYRFYATGVDGLTSMNDGLHYTTSDGGKITKYSYETGEQVAELLSVKSIKADAGITVNFDAYAFSADEKKVLLSAQTEDIYRYSSRSIFYIWDFETKKLIQLADEKVRNATFSPRGDKVAYVSGNNLFMFDAATGKTTQITTDGATNQIINGTTDWVYEEEFAFDRAFWWSPKGDYIAYLRFDETAVPEFSMDVYGKELYPEQVRFKYPKAGEVNSVVTAHIYNVTSGDVNLALGCAEYEYIPRLVWKNAETLVAFTMNRHQNHLKMYQVMPAKGEWCSPWFEETDSAFIEIDDHISFLKDGGFVWLSDRSGYLHLHQVGNDGKFKKQITSGNWDVTEFYGVDEAKGTLYYQSNEAHISEKNVYSISLSGKSKKQLTPQKGSNEADFSTGFTFFINTYTNTTTPPFVTLHNATGKQIRVLKDNAAKAKLLTEFNLSPKEFFTLPTASGQQLSAWMIKPLNFDANKKYPVLMFVYGGPGDQQVLNQYDAFNGMWYQSLAAQGYMIVCVDGRGTGGRGREFRKVTYQQLGKYETIDQTESAQYLATMPYVDGSRIGIWGWSYGGYMSSNCLFQAPETFKMAIAVAPVTNWRFYDNIYTERYMRTPQENADGYDKNSPINHVKGLKGKYLLIHGSADDNVHMQNTMRMVEELVQANKQFEVFIYPDKNHSIFGGNTRFHLFKMMTDFIQANL